MKANQEGGCTNRALGTGCRAGHTPQPVGILLQLSDGTQGRNTFRGPGFTNLDLGVFKNFTLTERLRLQFRGEFFNALNHANFESPRDASNGSPQITSTLFGRTCCVAASTPSSANVIATGESARVIQFALKLSF